MGQGTSSRVIHSDPEILGGTPVFVGTRVPLKDLMDYIEVPPHGFCRPSRQLDGRAEIGSRMGLPHAIRDP